MYTVSLIEYAKQGTTFQFTIFLELEIADYLESQIEGLDPIDVYAFACNSFACGDARLIFTYTSFAWAKFGIQDLESLFGRVSPRPEPCWAWDGGEYADVSFFAHSIGLNVFRLANSLLLSSEDYTNIVTYGRLNAEIICRQAVSEPDEKIAIDIISSSWSVVRRSEILCSVPAPMSTLTIGVRGN